MVLENWGAQLTHSHYSQWFWFLYRGFGFNHVILLYIRYSLFACDACAFWMLLLSPPASLDAFNLPCITFNKQLNQMFSSSRSQVFSCLYFALKVQSFIFFFIICLIARGKKPKQLFKPEEQKKKTQMLFNTLLFRILKIYEMLTKSSVFNCFYMCFSTLKYP